MAPKQQQIELMGDDPSKTPRSYGSVDSNSTETSFDEDGELTTSLIKTSTKKPAKRSQRALRLVRSAIIAFSVVAIAAVCLGWGTQQPRGIGHHHFVHHSKPSTLPTLLSLRNDSSSGQAFIYALVNPLYDELQNASFHYSDMALLRDKKQDSSVLAGDESLIAVTAEPLTLHGGDSLTVRWTNGANKQGKPLINPSSHQKFVLGLYCTNDNDDDDDNDNVDSTFDVTTIQSTQQLLEVGTLSQIQATHRATLLEQDLLANNNNTWWIEKFPVYRFSTCRFLMYYKQALKKEKARTAAPAAQLHFVASSPAIRLTSVTNPFGVHLSATTDPTEMVVSFSTGLPPGTHIVTKGFVPVARYGTSNPPSNTVRVTGETTTYQASDMCMEPANVTEPGKFVDPGLLHTVVLSDLEPDTTYFYQVGVQHGQGVTWSDTFSFVSALPAGDATPFSYLAYADQGCPEGGWEQGAAWMAALTARELPTARMIHHFGDLSYARGAAHQWDGWLDMVQSSAANVPYHVSVGNHEYDYTAGGANGKDPSGVTDGTGFHPDWGNFGNDSGGECGVPVSKRFTMPQSPGSNGVFWYSHDFGLVHTTVLSSEHDLSHGSPQYKWLVADLAAVDRSVTPWVVVEVHRALYESEKEWDQNAVGIAMRYEMENVLFDHKVDVVFSGHYHSFLRTCDGLHRSRCGQGGPIHITVGTAGAHLDDADIYDTDWTMNYIPGVYGYGRVTISNSSALLFEFVRAGSEDDPYTGEVLDFVWVLRDR